MLLSLRLEFCEVWCLFAKIWVLILLCVLVSAYCCCGWWWLFIAVLVIMLVFGDFELVFVVLFDIVEFLCVWVKLFVLAGDAILCA